MSDLEARVAELETEVAKLREALRAGLRAEIILARAAEPVRVVAARERGAERELRRLKAVD